MKTNLMSRGTQTWLVSETGALRRVAHAAWMLMFLVVVAWPLLHLPAHAVLPEPDNIFFGTIARDGILVTGADYDVVVEVRRTTNGPPIASYVMGSNARLGHYYSIRVKFESIAPVLDAEATQTNDRVYLVASDLNGILYGTNVTIGPRGTLRQYNLGTTVSGDSDGDGLPDNWELARFGNLNNGPGTLTANGQTTLNNFLTGADPNSPNDGFRLSIERSGAENLVSFFARQAAGPGYEGLSRYYALEYTTNLGVSPWLPVISYTNVLGNNTTVTYSGAATSSNVTYRGQARLTNP